MLQELKQKTTIIELKTIIGFGAPNEGLISPWRAPLGPEGIEAAKKAYGMGRKISLFQGKSKQSLWGREGRGEDMINQRCKFRKEWHTCKYEYHRALILD